MLFRILGPLEVFDGTGWTPVRASKMRSLTAAVLIRPRTVVTIDQLVHELWGDRPPKTAVTQVHGLVLRLRRTMDDAGGRLLVTEGSGYRLDVGDRDVDARRFAAEAERGHAELRAGRPERAREVLGAALSLWRGPALADVAPTPTVDAEAGRLTEERLAAVESRIDADLAAGRSTTLVGELQRLVDEHPLREGLWLRLMLALYCGGRQAEALRAFRRLRTTLVDEVGVEPCAEVRLLHQRMLSGAPVTVDATGSVVASPAEGAAGGSGGSGASGASSGASTGSAGSDAGRPPRQLPPVVPGFVGRDAELAVLDGLLVAGAGAGVAVTGIAGVGKTALALRWAHGAADRFPDGQLYANLRGHDPAERPVPAAEVLAGFLRALGVAATSIPASPDERAALYRTRLSGCRVLVVLDDAAHPDQVRPLLPPAGSAVLVTARDDLRGLAATHGVRRIPLEVLARDEAVTLLAGVLGSERSAADPDGVTELARLCGDLPLALRIAAANVVSRQHGTVADQVRLLHRGDRLGALAVPGDRRAAVRTAFDVSYSSLDPEARELFRLLGAKPGPDFTAETAAALVGAGVDEAAPVLDRLAAAHLVQPIDADRFTFHDLIRLHAAERAAGGPTVRPALQRLLLHYVRTAEAAAEILAPAMMRLPAMEVPAAGLPAERRFTDGDDALAWLDAERANLVAATVLAAEQDFGRVTWQLADALRAYFWARRLCEDWTTVANAGRVAATAASDRAGLAASLLSIGLAQFSMGNYEPANDHLAGARDQASRIGWQRAEATALNGLAICASQLGHSEQAVGHLTEALRLDRQLGSREGEAGRLINLGLAYLDLGRLHDAVDCLRAAEAVQRELGNRNGQVCALENLGDACRRLGDHDAALAALTEALDLGLEHWQAAILADLGAVHRDAGRFEEARTCAEQALAQLDRDQRDDHQVRVDAPNVLASTLFELGRFAEAEAHHADALQAAETSGFTGGRIDALVGLGRLRDHQGRHADAVEHGRRAVALAREHKLVVAEGCALDMLAIATRHAGQHADAAVHADAALAIRRATGHRRSV